MNLVSKKLSRVVRDFFVNQHLVMALVQNTLAYFGHLSAESQVTPFQNDESHNLAWNYNSGTTLTFNCSCKRIVLF